MKLKIERRFAAEQLALRANWLLILAAGLLGYGSITSTAAIAGFIALVALNAVAYFAVRSQTVYAERGQYVCSLVRLTFGLIFAWNVHSEIWMLAVAAAVLDAYVNRDRMRVIGMSIAFLAIEAVSIYISHQLRLGSFFVFGGTAAGTILGTWMMRTLAQAEQLDSASRRLSSLLQCGTELAVTSELNSVIIDNLKLAIYETGATCGYVMLIDDQRKDVLVTEAAFGTEGEFEFPQEIAFGSGLSGYAAKLGQPISISDVLKENREFDFVTDEVKSACSIPLSIRSYTKAGQAAVDQILGVMTLLDTKGTESFADADLELLRSLGSLMSVAVSNARMEERRRTTFLLTLESLATALEARDEYTRGHSQRVCEVSLMIGERLGFGPEAMEELRVGTILHDIGKIGVPDAILNKRARLTDEEFSVMKSHPVIGYEICKPLTLSEGVLMIIRNHHEKLDGSGYPDGLKGGELPLSLRIVCVADAFDAMSSRRPYRSVMETSNVLAELSKGAGTQFDPVVVEHLKTLMTTDRLRDLYRQYWGDSELRVA